MAEVLTDCCGAHYDEDYARCPECYEHCGCVYKFECAMCRAESEDTIEPDTDLNGEYICTRCA